MEEIIITKNSKETQSFGESLARSHLCQGETLPGKVKIVLLYGNLGAGKTTFVQGLAKGHGITKRIISPTFIIIRSYELRSTSHELPIKNFYHVDLYRLQSEKEIEGLGLFELMKNPNNIVVVEWPERLGNLLPKNATSIYFETIGENERKITVKLLNG